MTKNIIFILLFINLSCNRTTNENKINQSELELFDTIPPAIKQYYFYEWENYNGRLDTCYCILKHKDTLKIVLENKHIYGGNGLIINIFNSTFTGYFYHSDDYSHYKISEYKKQDSYIEVPAHDLQLKIRSYEFQINDTLNGSLWATSAIYFDHGIKLKDRFEGFFKCTIQEEKSNNR